MTQTMQSLGNKMKNFMEMLMDFLKKTFTLAGWKYNTNLSPMDQKNVLLRYALAAAGAYFGFMKYQSMGGGDIFAHHGVMNSLYGR